MKDSELRLQFNRLCKSLGVGYDSSEGIRQVSEVDIGGPWSIALRLRELESTVQLFLDRDNLSVESVPYHKILVKKEK